MVMNIKQRKIKIEPGIKLKYDVYIMQLKKKITGLYPQFTIMAMNSRKWNKQSSLSDFYKDVCIGRQTK